MFERYTEQARRVIFYARYEASQFGSKYIETFHLLLGLMREVPEQQPRFLGGEAQMPEFIAAVRAICVPGGKPYATSVDLPLSHPARRVLAFAAEESQRAEQTFIGPIHLLAGLLREKGQEAAVLERFGITLDRIRDGIRGARIDGARGPGAAEAARPLVHIMLDAISDDRLDAVARLLEIARSEWFELTANTSGGVVTVTFPEEEPPVRIST